MLYYLKYDLEMKVIGKRLKISAVTVSNRLKRIFELLNTPRVKRYLIFDVDELKEKLNDNSIAEEEINLESLSTIEPELVETNLQNFDSNNLAYMIVVPDSNKEIPIEFFNFNFRGVNPLCFS